MNRRSPDQIVSKILDICMEGAYKTHIIYKANLNFSKANRYLESMKEQGLLSHINNGSKTIYKTTKKGRDINYKFKQLQEVLWGAPPLSVGNESSSMSLEISKDAGYMS